MGYLRMLASNPSWIQLYVHGVCTRRAQGQKRVFSFLMHVPCRPTGGRVTQHDQHTLANPTYTADACARNPLPAARRCRVDAHRWGGGVLSYAVSCDVTTVVSPLHRSRRRMSAAPRPRGTPTFRTCEKRCNRSRREPTLPRSGRATLTCTPSWPRGTWKRSSSEIGR